MKMRIAILAACTSTLALAAPTGTFAQSGISQPFVCVAQAGDPRCTAPVLVLGGNIGGGWSRNSYSDFPTFDGSGAGGGVYGAARFYVQPNFFVGPEAGFMLLNINARNPDSAFGFVRNQAYLGGQGGVTFQGPGATKVNLYSGLDATWSRVTVGVEAANERMSKNLGGWSVHGGVELQPIPSIPTLRLGLDLRHSDVSGTIGGDPTHVRWNMLSLTLSSQY